MAEDAPFLPGLSPIAGKSVHVDFEGGLLTSGGRALVLAEIERKLAVTTRLARCIEDPRAPERVQHSLAEMIRFRILMITAGYEVGNDCDTLRDDPASRWPLAACPRAAPSCARNRACPGWRTCRPGPLMRMMDAMVELFCRSFEAVPRRILPDIDDTLDRVHGGQQLSMFDAHHVSRCFLPIHIYEATTSKPVAVILRPGKTPDGTEVTLVLRHVVGAIRRRWPRVDIVIRGDSHYARPEAMTWVERNRVGYIFGLAGNRVLHERIADLIENVAVRRAEAVTEKVRRFRDLRYAARSWKVERRVIARVEATCRGGDSRFIVTNLAGAPHHLSYGRMGVGNLPTGRSRAPGLARPVCLRRRGR